MMILSHLLPIVFMLSEPLVRNVMFRGTYVEWILAPEKGEKIQKTLDKFNELGYNNSVKYKGYRPIYIYESELPAGILGRAMSLPAYCTIEISNDIISDKMLEEVTMHEYVHCFGYGHSLGNCTLMYWSYEPYCFTHLMNFSKQYYAKQIAEKFYE